MNSLTRNLMPLIGSTLLTLAWLIPPAAASGLMEPPTSDESTSEESTSEESKAEASDEDFKNTIKWQTSSEVDNFGFDVFRADTAEGPWEQINPETLEGQGTTDEITSYAFEDRTIDPCRSYFYYVESISMNGDREHFTPVGQAKAKLPADDPRCSSADPV